MKKALLLTVVFLLAINSLAIAQEDPLDPVINAIRDADSRTLSEHLNQTLEIRLPDNVNTCSSSQAEMILKDFFKKSPPDTFDLVQKGTTDTTSRFAICKYVSGSKKYQVYIYMKKEKERFLVQKIQFEEKK